MYVEITGFKHVKIDDIEKFFETIRKEKQLNVEIQFFDAKLVATWQHLYFAVLNALTAFKNRENISKSLAMETMIYASAQHQIRKAMELLGVKPTTTSEMATLIIGKKPDTIKSALSTVLKHVNVRCDEMVLELSKEKASLIQKSFGISDVELKTVMKGNDSAGALTDLVIERMALLATQR
jgi:tRNA threonylcarbamoyladenosine modification (KEOPS) complex Cgi121 subunit